MARRRGMPSLRPAGSFAATGMGCARRERADRPALGNYVPRSVLAKPDAFLAARLVPGSVYAMLGLDFLPVRAVIVIVMDIPMLRRVFERVRVVRRYLCHWASLLSEESYQIINALSQTRSTPGIQDYALPRFDLVRYRQKRLLRTYRAVRRYFSYQLSHGFAEPTLIMFHIRIDLLNLICDKIGSLQRQ